MMRFWFGLLTTIATVTFPAHSAPPEIKIAPIPTWALPPPNGTSATPPKDAPFALVYADNQFRITKDRTESFIAQRFKLLKPAALQIANLNFAWMPGSGQATVHRIRLIHADGSAQDVLDKRLFKMVQNEQNLEQSVLSGIVTAVFATPGVEVGDEIEFSATISYRDATLGNRPFAIYQLPVIESNGVHRVRIMRPDGVPIVSRKSPDLGTEVTPSTTDGELIVTLDNPKSANVPTGAPGRFTLRRLVEFSSFKTWGDVSTAFWPHYQKAATLSTDSPVQAEVAKISAATPDPHKRALMALKLVQDRVRYVFVGLGAGGYTPATADQTWQRRYGDCKGKTVLLLAILKGLGIEGEAILVNAEGADGIEDRLPSPGLFNHVLVRATIDGKPRWLDGTLASAPDFDFAPPPLFRTALPLRASGAGIEIVGILPRRFPESLDMVNIDASAGIDKPAITTTTRVLHSAAAAYLRTNLGALVGDDLKNGLAEFFGYSVGSFEVEKADWSYDDETGTLTMSVTGKEKLDWEGDSPTDKYYYLPGAGFTPPDPLKRPKEQDQSIPWAVEFPTYRCWITTIKLPPTAGRQRWTYNAKPVARDLGGIRYYRQATLKGNFVQTIMSKKSLLPELQPREAAAIEPALVGFDKEKSYVFMNRVAADAGDTDDPRPILESADINWRSGEKICQKSAVK